MKSILLIEDCVVFQKYVQSILKNSHNLYIFDNAEYALETIEMIVFDLIITDCNLIGMSGLKFIELSKEYREKHSVSLIFASSCTKETSKATALGVNILMKPFKAAQLIDMINGKV